MRCFGEHAGLLAEAGVDVTALVELEAAHERALDLPAGGWIDAHVHLGRDRDGHSLSQDGLIADLDRFEIARAVVFPPNDPGADGQFAQANRLVFDAADGHPGRLVPFLRLDPMLPWERALSEALDRGARGLKLHPVAQRIRPESDECVALVSAATAAGLPVLFHAGFGARALAQAFVTLVERVPACRLILAHGGRGDAPALAAAFMGYDGVLFDTSLAALPDLVRLGPTRLVFESDRPFGDILGALQLVSLAARVGEWTRADTRSVLGGTLDSWLSLGTSWIVDAGRVGAESGQAERMNRLDVVAIVAAAAQAEMGLNRCDPVAAALVALAARSAASSVGGRELALAAEITRRVDVNRATPTAAASRKVAQTLCRSALQQAQAALTA